MAGSAVKSPALPWARRGGTARIAGPAQHAVISDRRTGTGFGHIEGHVPPRWPGASSPKRYHLDLYVDDLDKAEAVCMALGAAKPGFQPGGDRWRVLNDPAGHPFCICVKSG